MPENPLLMSIGLPVYNGADYIAAAIESILQQTYRDLELIICDNASTDETGAICRHYAEQDSRIQYYRNNTNLGAHPNYNRCYELASGYFFKWASHDDLLHPEFLAKCIAGLAAVPESVVCQSHLQYIDAQANPIGVYDSGLIGSDARSPVKRFASLLLHTHPSYEIMGVFRRSALVDSLLLESFHGADRALLAELALRGPFVQISEPLLLVRDHQERYSRAQVKPRDRANWHDTRLSSRLTFPTWRLYGEYCRMVGRNLDNIRDRFGCYAVLIAWWGSNWNTARMLVDLVAAICPNFTYHAERFKQRFFAPAPGADEVNRQA